MGGRGGWRPPQIARGIRRRQMLVKRLRPPMWQERASESIRSAPTTSSGHPEPHPVRGRISLGVGLSAVTLSGLIGVPSASSPASTEDGPMP